MAKVTFFEYNTRVLLENDNDTFLFDTVSECLNYCEKQGIEPIIAE